MFRKKRRRPQLEGSLKCGWCGDEIADDTELFGIKGKAVPGLDLSGLEGKLIDVFLTKRARNVQAMVVAFDSPAKKEGIDMVYPACGESCAEALRQGLEAELG